MIACQQQDETVGPEGCGEKQNHSKVQTFQSEDVKKRCGWKKRCGRSAEAENKTTQCRSLGVRACGARGRRASGCVRLDMHSERETAEGTIVPR